MVNFSTHFHIHITNQIPEKYYTFSITLPNYTIQTLEKEKNLASHFWASKQPPISELTYPLFLVSIPLCLSVLGHINWRVHITHPEVT